MAASEAMEAREASEAWAELATDHPASLKQRAARVLGTIVFTSLLGLIVLTAIPYGTVEAWWKAFFVCAVFSPSQLSG